MSISFGRTRELTREKYDRVEFGKDGRWAAYMNFRENGYNFGCPIYVYLYDEFEPVWCRRFKNVKALINHHIAGHLGPLFADAKLHILAYIETQRHLEKQEKEA